MFQQGFFKFLRLHLSLLLLIGGLCQTFSAFGQDYIHSVKKLSAEDGLNGQIKFKSLIDKRGYLWLSSFYGVDRYDGLEVLNIVPPKDVSKNIEVLDLFESEDGEMWMILGNSVDFHSDLKCYHINAKNGALTDWKIFLQEKAVFHEDEVFSYRITKNGLNVLLKNGDLWNLQETFHYIRKLSDFQGYSHLNWMLHSDGSIIYGEDNLFIKKNGAEIQQKEFDGQVFKVLEDPEGGYQIYVIKDAKFIAYHLDEHFNTIKSYFQHKTFLPFKEKTPNGNYLWQVNGTLQLFDAHDNLIWDISKDLGLDFAEFPLYQWAHQSPYSNQIIIQGFENPYILDLTTSPFKNYLVNKKQPMGMRGIAVSKNGNIFASSGPKSYFLNASGDLINTIVNPYLDEFSLIYSNQNYYDKIQNSFWAISPIKIFEYYPAQNKTVKYNSIDAIDFTGIVTDENLAFPLALTTKGVYAVDRECACFKKYVVHNESQSVNSEKIQSLNVIGNLGYFITTSGLHIWDIEKNIIIDNKAFPEEIYNAKFLDVHFELPNEIWLATNGTGVYKWDFANDKTIQYNTDNGLSRNIVYAIKKDSLGRFWLPTTYGLNCLDPESGVVRNFLDKDGIPHFEFNTHSHHQDHNGHLYFGGLNGFTAFNPNTIKNFSSDLSNTLITNVKLHNIESGEMEHFNVDGEAPIIFNNGKEILEVKFTTINISNSGLPKFQYKFEETGEPWQNYSGTTLSFTNLNPGNYTLKIRGLNDQNSWSDKEATLAISVPTPFFQSSLFWILLIAVLLIAAYLFSNWRNANLRRNQIKLTQEVEKRTLSLQESKNLIERQASELAEVDRVKSRFFTNLSHELRTPLTLILNPLKKIRRSTIDIPKVKEDVDTAMAASVQLKSLIERVLRISEVDADSLALREINVSINHFIRSVIEPFRETATDLGIHFEIEAKESLDKIISIDFEKLKEIVESLISNALKFCKEGDRIKVGLTIQNNQFTFSCQDSGIGIPVEQQEKIFTNYYQNLNPAQPAMGGLGLGLPMAKSFANIMNGYLIVHSQPGKGATFTLTAPCTILKKEVEFITAVEASNEKINSNSDQVQPKTPISKDKPSILLVEDHKLMNRLIANILQPEYNIVSTTNGKKALELLSRSNGQSIPVDLIISDWMMPQMDGPTFLQELKQLYNSIPVILLTARASQADKLSMLKIGVDDYMTKPFDPEELKVRVLNLLHNKRERLEALDDGLKAPQPQFAIEPTVNEKWLQQLESEVTKNLGEAGYSIVDLAKSMNLGERQLNRKIKSLTGLTPGNYIRECRLLKARHLLEHHQLHTVSEVCFAVGFSTQEYFSKKFFERFGKLPSTYLS